MPFEFPSHPHFGIKPPEDIGVPETSVERKKVLEQIDLAISAWIGVIETLEAKVPHNDVIVDDRTLAFSVVKNAWLANLMELTDLRDLVVEEDSHTAN